MPDAPVPSSHPETAPPPQQRAASPAPPARRPGGAFRLSVLLPLGLLALLGMAGLAYLANKGLLQAEAIAVQTMHGVRSSATDQSTDALTATAERTIRQHAQHVAAQVATYIAIHPRMTMADLQQDDTFRSIAVQPVGNTGYSALTDTSTLVCRFHDSPRIVDLDLHTLADELPGFWRIMSATQGGHPADGYYDWEDDDGRIRKKYMAITIAPQRTADGVLFSVASTTYLDEFLRPVAQLEQRLTDSIGAAATELRETNAATRRGLMTGMILLSVLVLAIFAGMLLLVWNARSAEKQRAEELLREVAERERAQEALVESEKRLRQSEKMEAIGQLAGGVAHDFNNRLVAISGFAQLLAIDCTEPELQGHAERIVQASKRASALTGQLLAFARKREYQAIPVDIHALIREVILFLRHSLDKRVVIQQRLEADESTTHGDPAQLQNALLNLAINARDAMPDGGELTFSTDITSRGASGGEVAHDVHPGRYLRVRVRDTGTGMDAQTQRRIFEPFFTTKKEGEGTGMGLAVVFGTVEAHNGLIQVQSSPGKGTTFTLLLPLFAAETLDPDAADGTLVHGDAHVLVVDDEEEVRQFTSLALRKLGYQVTACASGPDAVEHVRRAAPPVDIVLLDLVLSGVSGAEAFHALREVDPDIRIVLTSGYTLSGEAQQILDAGACGFVEKPFQIAELSRELAEALGRTVPK